MEILKNLCHHINVPQPPFFFFFFYPTGRKNLGHKKNKEKYKEKSVPAHKYTKPFQSYGP